MYSFRKILLTLFLLSLSINASAQSSADTSGANDGSDPYDTVAYFMYGLNYLSDNVWLGRKDSAVIPYFTPYIGYHFSSGLYFKAMVSFATIPKDNPTDLATLEADYDHSWGNLDLGFTIDKYFYDSKSEAIRASTTASTQVYAQYGNKVLQPQVNVYWNINKGSTDYAVGLQADHSFSLLRGKLTIDPMATVNAGTQNYYDEYFKKKIEKNGKTRMQKTVTDAAKFKPLDYELATIVTYRPGKWQFTGTFTYAIPVSPSTLTLPTKVVKEQLTNTFYVQLDVCHR